MIFPSTGLRSLLLATVAGGLPLAGAMAASPPQVRGIIAYPMQAYADPAPDLAQSPGLTVSRPRFEAAPVPNRDVDTPAGPRASNDPQLAPSLFNRRDQYRGEGLSPNSSAQIDQERRLRPGAGFTLKMPLQQ